MCKNYYEMYICCTLQQVEGGNLEVVKELLKLGANVDLQDDVSMYIWYK